MLLPLHDECIGGPVASEWTSHLSVLRDSDSRSKLIRPIRHSQGGFCQMTCERCSCAEGSGIQCAKVLVPDVRASNGIIQVCGTHYTMKGWPCSASCMVAADIGQQTHMLPLTHMPPPDSTP